MAKQRKVLPARRPRNAEASLLLRSAESLGRVIGTLQRQLDGNTRRPRTETSDRQERSAANNGSSGGRSTSRAKRAGAKTTRSSTGAVAAKRAASRKTGASKSRRG